VSGSRPRYGCPVFSSIADSIRLSLPAHPRGLGCAAFLALGNYANLSIILDQRGECVIRLTLARAAVHFHPTYRRVLGEPRRAGAAASADCELSAIPGTGKPLGLAVAESTATRPLTRAAPTRVEWGWCVRAGAFAQSNDRRAYRLSARNGGLSNRNRRKGIAILRLASQRLGLPGLTLRSSF
jgi:hypothetical protein